MKPAKRIAFVYGRPTITGPRFEYMPFALSTVKKLAENKDHQIDLFLIQKSSQDIVTMLPSNVVVRFLDNDFVWSFGTGRVLFHLLTLYFRMVTRGGKYNEVWGLGQAGTVLAGSL